uniref:Claudin 2 n=1 Tax=Scleropages formosus TaxID=113540 RepID=A0A8C9RFK2_SCLFO
LLGAAGEATILVTVTSAFIGSNIVTAVVNTKGLWMVCVHQSTGTFQCESYNSMLALPTDLQAARAMMVISVALSVMGCATACLGMKCTVCLEEPAAKTKVAGAAGGCFLLAGFFCLVPVSWITNSVVQTFYQPAVPASHKYELGECLYVGLSSFLLSLLGGALLCLSCCDSCRDHRRFGRQGSWYPYHSRAPRASSHGRAYHPPTLQAGADMLTKHQMPKRNTSRSSGRSSGPDQDPKPALNNTAAGYDVTGYV